MLELSQQLISLNSEIESRGLTTMELEEVLAWLQETNGRVVENWQLGVTVSQITDALHSLRQVDSD